MIELATVTMTLVTTARAVSMVTRPPELVVEMVSLATRPPTLMARMVSPVTRP